MVGSRIATIAEMKVFLLVFVSRCCEPMPASSGLTRTKKSSTFALRSGIVFGSLAGYPTMITIVLCGDLYCLH